MRNICITALVACLVLEVEAQEPPLLPNYLVNDLLHNPAIAGSKTFNPVRLTARRQWVGIDKAPQMHSLSFDGLLFQYRIGMGFSIVNQITGPTTFNALNYYWNYRVPYSTNSFISFGIAATVTQYMMDHRVLNLEDPNDPLLKEGFRRSYLPDGSAGIYMYSTRWNKHQYHLGVSAQNILEYDKGLPWHENQLDVQFLKRRINAMAGYQIKLFGTTALEPSVVIHTDDPADPEQLKYTGSARFIVNDSVMWIGASYRHEEEVTGFFSLNLGTMNIIYSYGVSLTDIQTYGYGNHELSLAIYFRRRVIKKL